MCLAIPGKVVEAFDQRGLRMARVQFGGITREACLEYVPETQVGDYVLVHVGFAISRVDEAEAERTYEALRELDQLTELESPVVEEIEPVATELVATGTGASHPVESSTGESDIVASDIVASDTGGVGDEVHR